MHTIEEEGGEGGVLSLYAPYPHHWLLHGSKASYYELEINQSLHVRPRLKAPIYKTYNRCNLSYSVLYSIMNLLSIFNLY